MHTAAGFVHFVAEQAGGGVWIAATTGIVFFVHVHSVAVGGFGGDEQQADTRATAWSLLLMGSAWALRERRGSRAVRRSAGFIMFSIGAGKDSRLPEKRFELR